MKCEDIHELISAYMDNEATLAEKELVEKHLAECSMCARMLKEYKILDRKMDKLPKAEASFSFNENIHQKLGYRIRLLRLKMIGRYAAAAILVICVSVFAFVERQPATTETEMWAELPNLHLLEDPDYLGVGYFSEGIGMAMGVEIAVTNGL